MTHKNYYIGVIVIFSALFSPLINYISVNQNSNGFDFYYPLLFTTILFIFINALVYFFSKFTNYDKLKTSILFSFLYLSFFYYEYLYNFILISTEKNYILYINFFAILAILLLLIIFLFVIRYKAFLKFTIIFIVIFLATSIVNFFFIGGVYNDHNGVIIAEGGQTKNLPLYSPIKIDELKNIYYIIADGLGSNRGLEAANVDTSSLDVFKETLTRNGFNITKSTSSYNTTYLSIQSIFDLDYPVTDYSDPYKNRMSFFPSSISFLNAPDTSLKRTLLNIGYKKIYWYGNIWGRCTGTSNLDCPPVVENNKIIYRILSYFLQNNSLMVFLQNSIYPRVVYKLSKLVSSNNIASSPIKKLTIDLKSNSFKNNTPSFFFVHQLTPHPPYVTENCKPIFGTGKESWNDPEFKNYYNSSILCLNKQVTDLINAINKHDKDALIVIQGDHGSDFNDNSHLFNNLNHNYFIERFSIFNALKLTKDCNRNLYDNIGDINSARLVIACASGLTITKKAN